MTTPGSNLLAQAARLIKMKPIQYYKYTERTLNANRQWVAGFEEPVPLMASVQAVPRSKYELLGLDFQKQYVKVYMQLAAQDLERDASGDKFIFNGSEYKVESDTDWFVQDGWVQFMAIKSRGNNATPTVGQ